MLRFAPPLYILEKKTRGAKTRPAVALTLDMLELAPPVVSSYHGWSYTTYMSYRSNWSNRMEIQEHIPLRNLTTLKIGGTARFFCAVDMEQKLKTAFLFAEEKKLPVVVLGGGSNILFANGEINALVLKIEITGIEWEDEGGSVLVIVGAGKSWDGLVAEAIKRGLWGIENLSGIPGTVGAAPIQNIGAYGAEIRNVLEWVEVFDCNTNYEQDTKYEKQYALRRISNAECAFGYRDSIFKRPEGKGLIITRVALRLSRNGAPNLGYKDLKQIFNFQFSIFNEEQKKEKIKRLTPLDIRQAVLTIRSKKFPDLRAHGTAGSFFKNPIVSQEKFDELKKKFPTLPGFELKVNDQELVVKLSLAWILDNICGLKGFTKGNVALFERQPIVLVATEGATAEEIQEFSAEIAERVKAKTGIAIAWEVQWIS